jgi:hypothetical protein
MGLREVTNDNLYFEEVWKHSTEARKKLWVTYNPILDQFLKNYIILKKKVNLDLIHSLMVPGVNLIRKRHVPKSVDTSDFEVVNVFGETVFKIDEEELALILLARS